MKPEPRPSLLHRIPDATEADPGWEPSSAPGCSQSSATTRTATRPPRPRKNYAATSPLTRSSGKKKVITARFVHNDRLVDALHAWAYCSILHSPGARAFYDEQRAKRIGHNDALRRLAGRLVGILHGCLKTRTHYNEATA